LFEEVMVGLDGFQELMESVSSDLYWWENILENNTTIKLYTVELVQSDTWALRHPVTTNKNWWFQSISVN
jgi:hypothetical protein